MNHCSVSFVQEKANSYQKTMMFCTEHSMWWPIRSYDAHGGCAGLHPGSKECALKEIRPIELKTV